MRIGPSIANQTYGRTAAQAGGGWTTDRAIRIAAEMDRGASVLDSVNESSSNRDWWAKSASASASIAANAAALTTITQPVRAGTRDVRRRSVTLAQSGLLRPSPARLRSIAVGRSTQLLAPTGILNSPRLQPAHLREHRVALRCRLMFERGGDRPFRRFRRPIVLPIDQIRRLRFYSEGAFGNREQVKRDPTTRRATLIAIDTRIGTCSVAAALLLFAGGCGGTTGMRPDTDPEALRSRAQVMIDHALRGDVAALTESLSTKCQGEVPPADLAFASRFARSQVGPSETVTIEAELVSPGIGKVRRTFPTGTSRVNVSTWVYQRDDWRLDDCE